MEANSVSKLFLVLCMVLQLGSQLIQCSVTYDRKAIVINGQRRILISGSIHYPRSTPDVSEPCPFLLFYVLFLNEFSREILPPLWVVADRVKWCSVQMWEDIIQKAKDGGLDVVETYVFWNVHEPSPGSVFSFPSIPYIYALLSFRFLHFAWIYLFFTCWGFSTISKGDMIWLDSYGQCRKQDCMPIFALDPMFVQSGILGTLSLDLVCFANWRFCNSRAFASLFPSNLLFSLNFHSMGAWSKRTIFDFFLTLFWSSNQRVSCLAQVCPRHQLQNWQWAFQGNSSPLHFFFPFTGLNCSS